MLVLCSTQDAALKSYNLKVHTVTGLDVFVLISVLNGDNALARLNPSSYTRTY